MKNIFAGAFLLSLIAFLLYVFIEPDGCARIERSTSPVRTGFDIARWGGSPWLSTEGRISMIEWSLRTDEAIQRFLAKQFFGSRDHCGIGASSSVHGEQSQSLGERAEGFKEWFQDGLSGTSGKEESRGGPDSTHAEKDKSAHRATLAPNPAAQKVMREGFMQPTSNPDQAEEGQQ